MRLFGYIILLAAILHCSYAPPVSPEKAKEQDSDVVDDLVSILPSLLVIKGLFYF